MSVKAYIGMGSNLDQPKQQLTLACAALSQLPHTQFIQRSSFYKSAPVGYLDQPDFMNAVAEIQTTLEPEILLEALLTIEKEQGRVRKFLNAPRTLDLDLLLYGLQSIDVPGLVVPHPRAHERAFVLVPSAQIAPELFIPLRGPLRELLTKVDPNSVSVLQELNG